MLVCSCPKPRVSLNVCFFIQELVCLCSLCVVCRSLFVVVVIVVCCVLLFVVSIHRLSFNILSFVGVAVVVRGG